MAIDLHALRTACAIAALAMGGAAASDSQTDPASNTRSANVIVRWQGDNPPTMINEPNGAPFTQEPADFTGTVPLPPAGVRFDDLDINFGDESYPLRLRIHPGLETINVTVAVDRPKSCADVFLKRLEKPTLTEIASVRAAFTLNNLIGRTGQNSCDRWPLRAEKARYDRYYNAMERSDVLVIPESVKAAYLSAAATDTDREGIAKVIASGDDAEHRKYAIALQRRVLTAARKGDYVKASQASSQLLDASQDPKYSAAVAKEIDPSVLQKQTSDLSVRAQAQVPQQ